MIELKFSDLSVGDQAQFYDNGTVYELIHRNENSEGTGIYITWEWVTDYGVKDATCCFYFNTYKTEVYAYWPALDDTVNCGGFIETGKKVKKEWEPDKVKAFVNIRDTLG